MIREYSYNNDGQVFLSPHFQVWEFRSFDDENNYLTSDKILIDLKLIDILENVYNNFNANYITVTSGYRSDDFDLRLGGFLGYHSKGMAVDFIVVNKDGIVNSKDVCCYLEDLGILAIGYGNTYTHIDTRDWKSFFDETNGNVNIDSWYNYFNIQKPTQEKYFYYTVEEDDCLSVIGDRFNKDWFRIYQDNKDIIGDNPDLIIPGQVLKIYND